MLVTNWFVLQIYKRLVDLLSVPAIDAQAAAVGALYNLSEVNMDCRLKLASERWWDFFSQSHGFHSFLLRSLRSWNLFMFIFIFRAVDRLLKVIRTPHPVHEVCRKSALILESLVGEPQNKALLLAYENAFSEILFSDSRQSDSFARILFELTSKPNNKVAAAQGIWGM